MGKMVGSGYRDRKGVENMLDSYGECTCQCLSHYRIEDTWGYLE